MRMGAPLVAAEVKAQANFVDIASHFTPLRRRGKQFVGLCPFHSERHPSFYVHAERKIFYCFGCQAGGDLFDFVMHAEDIPFSAALAWVNNFRCLQGRTLRGRRMRPAVFAGRARLGVNPPLAAEQPAYIARKPELTPEPISADSPTIRDCAAEAAFFTCKNQS